MKKIILYSPAILLLFFTLTTSAQENKKATVDSKTGFNLRTSLTSFLDADGGIMLGVGYRWSQKFSASIEPSFIFFSPIDNNIENVSEPTGFKLRADLKYHFPRRNERSIDFFIGPELHYKSVSKQREDVFGINCQNGQCAYFQEAYYTEVKKEIGGFIKTGMLVKFPFIQSDNLLLEIFLGIGAKKFKFSEKDLPLGSSFTNPPFRGIFGDTRNDFALPLLPVGIKIVYVL